MNQNKINLYYVILVLIGIVCVAILKNVNTAIILTFYVVVLVSVIKFSMTLFLVIGKKEGKKEVKALVISFFSSLLFGCGLYFKYGLNILVHAVFLGIIISIVVLIYSIIVSKYKD